MPASQAMGCRRTLPEQQPPRPPQHWQPQPQNRSLLAPGPIAQEPGPLPKDSSCHRSSSPEVTALCPQPRRVFQSPPPTHKLRETPSIPSSPWSGTDEACHELRELLRGDCAVLDGKVAESRPLSSVSTSAGPSPCPDDEESPIQWYSNDDYLPYIGSPDIQGAVAAKDAQHVQQEFEGPQAEKHNVNSQVRKVFVGGIPQEMGQDELYATFSKFAMVTRAWLQRHRAPATKSGPYLAQSHRGFGFVIFQDSSAVDKLLEGQFSKFISLEDGRRLEVKRALSTNDVMSSSSWNQEAAEEKRCPHPAQQQKGDWAPQAPARPEWAPQPQQQNQAQASIQWPVENPPQAPAQPQPSMMLLPVQWAPTRDGASMPFPGMTVAAPAGGQVPPGVLLPFQGQVAQMPQGNAMGWMAPAGAWGQGAVQTCGSVGNGPNVFASAGGCPPACAPPLGGASLSPGSALPPYGGVMLPDCAYMLPAPQQQNQKELEFVLLKAMPDHYDE